MSEPTPAVLAELLALPVVSFPYERDDLTFDYAWDAGPAALRAYFRPADGARVIYWWIREGHHTTYRREILPDQRAGYQRTREIRAALRALIA